MSFSVRDGKFDAVVLAGPRVAHWPTAGARAISLVSAQMGLKVGVFGGETLAVRGVIPLMSTGALVIIQDVQDRIHRIHARAVVRVAAPSRLPDSFEGWWSEGLLPLETATRLKLESQASWGPRTVILGTGNRAFKFGSALIESGVPEVICIESHAEWGAKRFAGWEVELRRFEMAGGKVVEAKPKRLVRKAPLLWTLTYVDAQGEHETEAARVVSAGPFRDLPGLREYPPGSMLFELEQTAPEIKSDDFEGWALEEERGRWLGARIAKALAVELRPELKDELERIYRRARVRLKRFSRHRQEPFTPDYQGKWVAQADLNAIKTFEGVPQTRLRLKPIASVECFENIACNLCEKACPTDAIRFNTPPGQRVLSEADCTSCGLCLTACPSGSTLMIFEKEDLSFSQLILPWRGPEDWKVGELAGLVNRKGETLGSGRVSGVLTSLGIPPGAAPGLPPTGPQLVQVDLPTHLIWEARGLRRVRGGKEEDKDYLSRLNQSGIEAKVEIFLNGERRLAREGIPTSVALFETGQARPRDIMLCPDGSCGMCHILVDGVKKPACRTMVRKGMAIRIAEPVPRDVAEGRDYESAICPCLGIARETVIERIRQGRLRSPGAVLSVTHVGEGKCHGQLCMESFRRLLCEEGLDCTQWIDWRFPWTEWVIAPKD